MDRYDYDPLPNFDPDDYDPELPRYHWYYEEDTM